MYDLLCIRKMYKCIFLFLLRLKNLSAFSQ